MDNQHDNIYHEALIESCVRNTPVEVCVPTEAERGGQNWHHDSPGSLTPSSTDTYAKNLYNRNTRFSSNIN